jgi:hypothetical protein
MTESRAVPPLHFAPLAAPGPFVRALYALHCGKARGKVAANVAPDRHLQGRCGLPIRCAPLRPLRWGRA